MMLGNKQIQTQKQQTAYDKKVTHELFEISMEWLEKYIEIAYKKEFPNWEKRKQIHDNNIKRQDIYGNPEIAEETLSTQLLLFQSTAKTKSPAIREEIKEEYYRWMNAVGIDVNNCPKRLKNFLFGINEILEGRGEKVLMDALYRKETIDSNSSEYMQQMMNLYANTQSTSQKEIEIEKSLRGKTDKDWKIKNKFGSGDNERGKQQFNKIAEEIAGEHDKFHFYPQQNQQQSASFGGGGGGSLPFFTNLDEVVQDVKNNPKNWRFDEIPTEIDRFGEAKKQELVIIHRKAPEKYNSEGKLDFNGNLICRWEDFKVQQRFEIKKVNKNITAEYLTSDEIEWVIREVKDNPSVWKIEKVERQDCLIHNLAQGLELKFEVGTLIHYKQNFNDLRWAEVEKAIIIEIIRNDIVNWEIRENVPLSYYPYGDAVKNKGSVLILKTTRLSNRDYTQGELVNQPGKVYREDYFNDKEQAKISEMFARFAVICGIRQSPNSFTLKNIPILNKGTGYEEEEEWIISNQLLNNPAERKLDDMGYLIFDANKMIRVKDLTEAEKEAIGYKTETYQQTQTTDNRPRGGGGGWGSTATWGFGTVISIIGLAFTR